MNMRGLRRKGTTIIEVVVAMAVGALVTYGGYSLVTIMARQGGATEKGAQVTSAMVSFLEQMHFDLRRAIAVVSEGDRQVFTIRVLGQNGAIETRQVTYRIEGSRITREGTDVAGIRDFDFSEGLAEGEKIQLSVEEKVTGSGVPDFVYKLAVGSRPDLQVKSGSVPVAFAATEERPSLGISEGFPEAARSDRGEPGTSGGGRAGPGEDGPGEPVAGGTFTPAEEEALVEGKAVAERPMANLAGTWIQFVAGGDEEAVSAEDGVFRARTSIALDGVRPVVVRIGDPWANEKTTDGVPTRTAGVMQQVAAASSRTEGYVAAHVPGGFDGAAVLTLASAGVAAAVPDLVAPASAPGGLAPEQPYGSGDPGGALPGDGTFGGDPEAGNSGGQQAGDQAGTPSDAEGEEGPEAAPGSPGDLDPPGASRGARDPAPSQVETAELPPPSEEPVLDEMAEVADQAGEDFPPGNDDQDEDGEEQPLPRSLPPFMTFDPYSTSYAYNNADDVAGCLELCDGLGVGSRETEQCIRHCGQAVIEYVVANDLSVRSVEVEIASNHLPGDDDRVATLDLELGFQSNYSYGSGGGGDGGGGGGDDDDDDDGDRRGYDRYDRDGRDRGRGRDGDQGSGGQGSGGQGGSGGSSGPDDRDRGWRGGSWGGWDGWQGRDREGGSGGSGTRTRRLTGRVEDAEVDDRWPGDLDREWRTRSR